MEKISVKNVCKKFKQQVIIDNFSIELIAGKVYGFSGYNGSGKTVLLKLLTGLIKPDEGEIRVDEKILGKQIDFPPSTGVIIDKPEFFGEYSGFKNLKLLAEIKNVINDQDIYEVLDLFGLNDYKKLVRKYSLGMIQRLGLAQAFMEKPDFVVLDEFTNALDKDGITFIHEYIKNYRSQSRIIILTSHYENDLLTLCDEIYSLDKGKVMKC